MPTARRILFEDAVTIDFRNRAVATKVDAVDQDAQDGQVEDDLICAAYAITQLQSGGEKNKLDCPFGLLKVMTSPAALTVRKPAIKTGAASALAIKSRREWLVFLMTSAA